MLKIEDLVIRNAIADDSFRIAEIEKSCFNDPWSKESFENDIQNNRNSVYFIAELYKKVIGFIVLWNVLDEGHILNIAVLEEYRNKGIGKKLLDTIFKSLKTAGITDYYLEVRKSNISARSFYTKNGFTDKGFRKDYYKNPTEDAIIMIKNMQA
jgi:ribosomal-protein-alanine N-acetyltransferase